MAAEDVRTASTNDLIEGFNNLNLMRQAGLMVGLAASVAIGFWVVLWSQGEDYRPLYSSLQGLDVIEVGEILKEHKVKYKVESESGALLVAEEDFQQAQMALAQEGYKSDKTLGYELLDQEQPLGTSQFMEATRYRRGLEGELARTITSINGVKAARVHLAIPKRTVFVRDNRAPTAAVFLKLNSSRAISDKQVRGIANLVAGSIPELDIDNVKIVDHKGNLLDIAQEDKQLEQTKQHKDYTRSVERDIKKRLQNLLARWVGEENLEIVVNADMDFTEVQQAEETFNNDIPAVRSEQIVNENSVGAAAGGVPGALANQPAPKAAAPENAEPGEGGGGGAPGSSRSQELRNYEIDRTMSFTQFEKGRLRRLSVSVVVADKAVVNAETGEVTRMPWQEEELERLRAVVRSAVGFSAARGDIVYVSNEAFLANPDTDLGPLPIWQQDWFRSLVKQLAGVAIIVALIIGLLRPVLKSLAGAGLKAREEDEAKELAALQAEGMDSFDSLSDEAVTLTGGDALALPSPEESYEQQLNAVKSLVAEDAGRVAQVIKRWINEE